MNKDPNRIFISYAREDLESARKIYYDLKAQGFQPWMDRIDLLVGQNWKEMILRAIRRSRFFWSCFPATAWGKKDMCRKN